MVTCFFNDSDQKSLTRRVGVRNGDAVATVTAVQHKHLTSLPFIMYFRPIQAAGTRPRYKRASAIFQQCGGGG